MRTDRIATVVRVPEGGISIDDPSAADVRALLERHLRFARSHSAPEDVHALDVDRLRARDVTFFSFRRDGQLLAVAALNRLDAEHAEVKSMHTTETARGRGIGRAMVQHLIGEARRRGFRRLSLEAGTAPAFTPAQRLYATAGFAPCAPFGDYRNSRASTFMTRSLVERDTAPAGR